MIKINQPPKFPIELVALYDENDKYVNFINKWQLMDVRIQIAEQKLEGYSFKYSKEGEVCTINILPDGSVDKWDDDLFDQSETLNQCIRLRTLQLT